jgi:hypothetical protein
VKRTVHPLVVMAVLATLVGGLWFGMSSWNDAREDREADRLAETFADEYLTEEP